ncbi:MAG: CHAD domain-containing protein [Rhizomicrobium sp.]
MSGETEIKFEVPAARLAAIAHQPWFKQFQAAAPKIERLVSVYFDTPKGALKRRHLSLRVRRAGARHLQTVKAGASPIERQEWEWEISGETPERKLARKTALKPFTARRKWRKLRPLFETEVERTAIALRYHDALIALALDKGRISAKGKTLAISEIELELKEGRMAGLADLAHLLGEKLPLALALQSKAARGYALHDEAVGVAVEACGLQVGGAWNAAQGFTAIALSCLQHATANRAAVLNGDAEGVHQMRVGLRRLRAALSLFKTLLRDAESERIKDNLKWLSGQLAPARDLDVFVANSVEPLERQETRHAPLKTLKAALEARRGQEFERMRLAVASPRYRRIVLETALWALAGKWAEGDDAMQTARRARPLSLAADKILKQRARKMGKALARLPEMDERGRHKLRIAVKTLRYASQFFAALHANGKGSKRRRAFEARLKVLQSALGRLNDIRMHEDYARRQVGKGSDGGSKLRVFGLGFVTGHERQAVSSCLDAAIRAGKRLRRQRQFWT